jgi:hypothetical protein
MILRLNDITVSYAQKELVSLGLGIADKSLDYEAVVSWARSRLSPKP